jgi:prephenate dehydrogenase
MKNQPATDRSKIKSVLVIGSSGKLGSALSAKLKEGAYHVIGLDLNQPPAGHVDHFIQADVNAPDALTGLSACDFDALLVTTPEAVAEAVVDNIIIPYGEHRLVIDFLSEKYFFSRLMESRAGGVEHVGVHPLFAPSVDWKNQNILVSPGSVAGARAQAFVRQLEAWGAVVHHCGALEHDRLMSLVQVGVHAAVIAYARFLVEQHVDFKLLDKISTPASRVMWAMIARIIGNDPSVYWEIQAHNATAQQARDELARSLRSLDEWVRAGDKDSFDASFDKLRSMFGEELEKYRRLADELFGHQVR